MSDKTQNRTVNLDAELIEGGWQKPGSPPTSMLSISGQGAPQAADPGRFE